MSTLIFFDRYVSHKMTYRTTRLQGDLIILGSTPPLSDPSTMAPLLSSLPVSTLPLSSLPARYAFSQAIARSTALSALESSLEIFLQSVALLPHSLSETGRPSLGRKALIKKLGELLRFRQGVNLNRENFGDTPDFYWTEPVLEGAFTRRYNLINSGFESGWLQGYFHTVSDALEIKARIASFNEKITYASEVSFQGSSVCLTLMLMSAYPGSVHPSRTSCGGMPHVQQTSRPFLTNCHFLHISSLQAIAWNSLLLP